MAAANAPYTTPAAEAERWTYARYLRETAEGEYFSVIGGERLMSPSPNRWHQTVLINLAVHLRNHVKQNRLGAALIAPLDVFFSEHEFVQPDFLFVANEHANRLTDNGVSGPPDLVVEIVSPGSVRADRVTKRNLYAKYGVREYWIVSPTERTVEVLALKGNDYGLAGLYEEAETVLSPMLPGLAIKVEQLFEE